MIELGRGAVLALGLAWSAAGCSGRVDTRKGSADSSAPVPALGGSMPASAGAGVADAAGESGGGTSGAGVNSGGRNSSGGSGTGVAGAVNTGGVFNDNFGLQLIPSNGWVDGAENALGIQGVIFGYADPTSKLGLIADFKDSHACVSGTAAKIDQTSTQCQTQMFTPPATDCYGEFWGAAIELNLNQPVDPATMQAGTSRPFDASALKGFAFELTGNTLPPPKSFRFQVENASTVFCNVPSIKVRLGINVVLFSDLVSECFRSPVPTAPTAQTAKSALLKISWHVLTNTSEVVPFDFCVSSIHALLQ